jgi:hypothetical protein
MTERNSNTTISLADLCRDAVERFGADWPRIQAYVAEQIALMPGEERKRLTDDVDRILSFFAPSRPSVLQ